MSDENKQGGAAGDTPQGRVKTGNPAVANHDDLQPTWKDKDGREHKKRILTGDRTTGKLHLGHYVGSLKNRVKLQRLYDTFILMADVQALTTHWENPKILRESVREVALDYLAAGLEPYTGGPDDGSRAKIVVQSHVAAIAELTCFYGLITPMSTILDNPTTKAEASQYGFNLDDSEDAKHAAILRNNSYLEQVANDHASSLQEEFTGVESLQAAELLRAVEAVELNQDSVVQEELEYVRDLREYNKKLDQYNEIRRSLLAFNERLDEKNEGSPNLEWLHRQITPINETMVELSRPELTKAMAELTAINQATLDNIQETLDSIRNTTDDPSIRQAKKAIESLVSGFESKRSNSPQQKEIKRKLDALKPPTEPIVPSHRRSEERNASTENLHAQEKASEAKEFSESLEGILSSTLLTRLLRESIIKIRRKQGIRQMTYGFLGYPVSQAADITFVNAHLVPVGEDQLPHIELTRDIVQRFNKQYGKRRRILTVPQALLGGTGTLKGLDGRKMSKSLGNAVYLSDSDKDIWQKLKPAPTDPQRVRKDDPGRPEVCTIFSYHQAFNGETETSIDEQALGCAMVPEVAENCRGAKWGCVECKQQLAKKLSALLTPMRERRSHWESHEGDLYDVLKAGTARGNEEGNATVERVKDAMHVDYWPKQ